MAKIKYGDAEVEASTQEMGEIAGALGIGISAPMGEPTPEEVSTGETMAAEKSTDMVGEPEAPTAGLSTSLVRRFMKQAGRHMVEPVTDGVTDATVRQMNDPALSRARSQRPHIPPPIDAENLARNIESAKVMNFSDKESHIMNFNTLSDNELRQTIGVLAERNAANIDIQRRGVMADEALYEMADILRSDPRFIKETLEMQAGTSLPPEKILALKQTMTLMAGDIHDLASRYNTLDDAGKQRFRNHVKMFDKLYGNFMGARAETGRSMRAMGIDDGLSADVRPDQLSALLQQESHGLSEEMIARQIALAENTQGVVAVLDSARPTVFTKSFDTAYEIFVNGILSGVKTHVVNFTGSAIRIGVNVTDTAVAGLFGRGAASHADSIARNEWKAQLFGLTTGWNDAFAISAQVMKTTKKYGDIDKLDTTMYDGFIKAETYGLDPEKASGKTVDWIGNIVRAPTERLMGGVDAFNKYMAEHMSIAGQAYSKAVGMQKELNLDERQTIDLLKQLIDNPTEEMKIIAKQDGKMMTFQEELGKSGKQIQKAIQGNRAYKGIVPFFKTPTNLIKQAYIERTPLGLLTKKIRDEITAGGRSRQLALSKITTGTMISTSLFMLAQNDMINGHYSKDSDIRRAQMNAGWEPMSFVSKNEDGTTTYVPFDRVEPFSYLFGMAADLSNISKEMELRDISEAEEESYNKLVTGFIISVSENTLNKSFMTGIRSAIEATQGGYKAEMWVKNTTNAFTPYSGARRNIANLIDPTRRRPDGLMDYWEEQITFWHQNAAPLIDVQGREVKKKHILIPWDIVKMKTNVVDVELLRLAKETGVSAVSAIKRKMDGVRLTPMQQATWGKYARADMEINGKTFQEAIKEWIKEPRYQDAFIDDQIKQLRELTARYDNRAKRWLLDNDMSLMRKISTKKNAARAERQANESGSSPKSLLDKLVDEDMQRRGY